MYELEFTKIAFKSLNKIPKFYRDLIIEKLEILRINPYEAQNVKNLKGKNDCYRLRVADYRVIFKILNKELVILIVELDHRKNIY